MKKYIRYLVSLLCVACMLMLAGCGNDLPATENGGADNSVNGDPNIANPNLGANNAGMELPEGYEEDRAKCETRMNELLKEGYSYEGLKDKLREEGFESWGTVAANAFDKTDWVEQAKIFIEKRINNTGYSVAMLRTELTEAKFKEQDIDQAVWSFDTDYKKEACLAAVTVSKDESYCHHRVSIRQELEVVLEFKLEEVDYAIDNADVDWNKLALNYIRQIDNQGGYPESRVGLENCVGDGHFFWDEIQYGIENLGIDWNRRACEYLNNQTYDRLTSKNDYKQMLRDEKFTEDEIKYAIKNCDFDWKDNASGYVFRHVWDFSSIADVKNTLRAEGYTEEEIDYAVSEWADHDW
ncbi:MAG: hypothetical protein E7509_00710 [Ruminococcus sp.]|nr:hypothetical protein [Ruminococcus sp.]